MISGRISSVVNSLPYQSPIVDQSKRLRVSDEYESFFNSLKTNVSSLSKKSFENTLRNPDFNFLSANGTSPVTEASGSPFEFLSNWFVNSSGGNTYTITPTAHSSIPFLGTGSNYFMNLNVSGLVSGLYLSNLNYSTTNAFSSVSKYSDQTVTFSSVVSSNNANPAKFSFSADIGSLGSFSSPPFYLREGINLLNITYRMPNLKDSVAAPTDNTEFRLNILDTGGGIDADIYYIKAEISDRVTPLQVDHTQEQLLINNLS